MYSNELISIIVPVYNMDKYLKRCLDSICQSTYENLEIICINDGSTDNSASILDHYAKLDPRILVIHQINSGVSSARNTGLKAVTGSYVAFVDSDDWVHKQYFEALLSIAHLYNADLVMSSWVNTDTYMSWNLLDLNKIKGSNIPLDRMLSSRESKNYIWGKLYKANLLHGCSFKEDITFSEDSLFNAQVLLNAEDRDITICYIPEKLYFYFKHQGSLSLSMSSEALLGVGKELFYYSKQANKKELQIVFLTESIKKTLNARYNAHVKKQKGLYKLVNQILMDEFKRLLSLKNDIGLFQTSKYMMLIISPTLYRSWRIHNDQTLLDYEKSQKQSKAVN